MTKIVFDRREHTTAPRAHAPSLEARQATRGCPRIIRLIAPAAVPARTPCTRPCAKAVVLALVASAAFGQERSAIPAFPPGRRHHRRRRGPRQGRPAGTRPDTGGLHAPRRRQAPVDRRVRGAVAGDGRARGRAGDRRRACRDHETGGARGRTFAFLSTTSARAWSMEEAKKKAIVLLAGRESRPARRGHAGHGERQRVVERPSRARPHRPRGGARPDQGGSSALRSRIGRPTGSRYSRTATRRGLRDRGEGASASWSGAAHPESPLPQPATRILSAT